MRKEGKIEPSIIRNSTFCTNSSSCQYYKVGTAGCIIAQIKGKCDVNDVTSQKNSC